jgi:hypothetical protein
MLDILFRLVKGKNKNLRDIAMFQKKYLFVVLFCVQISASESKSLPKRVASLSSQERYRLVSDTQAIINESWEMSDGSARFNMLLLKQTDSQVSAVKNVNHENPIEGALAGLTEKESIFGRLRANKESIRGTANQQLMKLHALQPRWEGLEGVHPDLWNELNRVTARVGGIEERMGADGVGCTREIKRLQKEKRVLINLLQYSRMRSAPHQLDGVMLVSEGREGTRRF